MGENTAEVRHPIGMNGKENKKENYCYKCGTSVRSQLYCHKCGRKLIWDKRPSIIRGAITKKCRFKSDRLVPEYYPLGVEIKWIGMK